MPHVSAIYTLYFAMFVLAFNGLYAKIIPADAVTITQMRSVVASLAFVVFLTLQKKALRLSHYREYMGVYGLGIILGSALGGFISGFSSVYGCCWYFVVLYVSGNDGFYGAVYRRR